MLIRWRSLRFTLTVLGVTGSLVVLTVRSYIRDREQSQRDLQAFQANLLTLNQELQQEAQLRTVQQDLIFRESDTLQYSISDRSSGDRRRTIWLPYFNVSKACIKNSGDEIAQLDRLDPLVSNAGSTNPSPISINPPLDREVSLDSATPAIES